MTLPGEKKFVMLGRPGLNSTYKDVNFQFGNMYYVRDL